MDAHYGELRAAGGSGARGGRTSAFSDHSDIPLVHRPGAAIHLIAGTAYGAKAPTGVLSPTLYVARPARRQSRASRRRRASRACSLCGRRHHRLRRVSFSEGTMLVLRPQARAVVCATSKANVMIIGGAPLEGPRHIWWNFVSSSKERIERAKSDWQKHALPEGAGRRSRIHSAAREVTASRKPAAIGPALPTGWRRQRSRHAARRYAAGVWPVHR